MTSGEGDIDAMKQKVETKNLRWSKPMDHFLLDLLVDEANLGHKVDKSFKDISFVRAAKEVSKKFQLVCTAVNVRNRMKTIKKKFKEVKQIESNNSGMSWDDNLKMWKCSEDVCKDYIRAHPEGEKYLNKPIIIYDELCIVCGDDQATGSFAKSSGDAFDKEEIYDTSSEDDAPPTNTKRPASSKGKPTKLHKKKHQISSLYFDMRQKESELADHRAKGYQTKAQTREICTT